MQTECVIPSIALGSGCNACVICRNESGDSPRIVMMNFGAPRVGNKEFVRVYCTTVPESYRVINKLDIIHRLPRLMKHVPREVSLEEDGDIVIDKMQSIKRDMHSQTDDVQHLIHSSAAKLLPVGKWRAPSDASPRQVDEKERCHIAWIQGTL